MIMIITTESTTTTRRRSLPAWYEGNRVDNTKEGDISAGDEEMEPTKRARRIMKDRFGHTLPTLRGQDVPRNEIYDCENDSQQCTLAGKSSSKICQDGTGTIAIASNNSTSNDRNANANSLARGRPTANVIDKMISSGAAARSGRGRAQAGFDVQTILRTRGAPKFRVTAKSKSSTDNGGGHALCVRRGYVAPIGRQSQY